MQLEHIVQLLKHPNDLRSLIACKIWREPLYERDPDSETVNERKCYEFLIKTSRSFSRIIQELNPELRKAIMLFYLILRGLDTIEDDMTISIDLKEKLLLNFHSIISLPGWKYEKSQTDDGILLMEYDIVIDEFLSLKHEYRHHITEATKEMGSGMAKYARLAYENKKISIESKKDYNKYCYYVAGLVGVTLSLLFKVSGFENPIICKNRDLSIQMGLLLQKTNIIRDFSEDFKENRIYWPKEIWSKYCKEFSDLVKPEFQENALNCISEMIVDALSHSCGILIYLSMLRSQDVFNFCAVPQVMAIETLALLYRNPQVLHKNVKIRKGQAAQLFYATTNMKVVVEIFLRNIREIHRKSSPKDPNFLKISICCAEIEQWIETVVPKKLREKLDRRQMSKKPEEKGENIAETGDVDLKNIYYFAAAIWVILVVIITYLAHLGGAK